MRHRGCTQGAVPMSLAKCLSWRQRDPRRSGDDVQPVRFEGKSMTPALNDGDRILMLKSFWQPQRGDVIVFYYPKDTTKSYIKRIVGLPNETIEINAGQVIINGNQLTETYVNPQQNMSLMNFPPLQIPAHKYYVLGDNRDHSSDSRIWGTVSEELIYGKYIFRYDAAK